jgi:hypothetical protein
MKGAGLWHRLHKSLPQKIIGNWWEKVQRTQGWWRQSLIRYLESVKGSVEVNEQSWVDISLHA